MDQNLSELFQYTTVLYEHQPLLARFDKMDRDTSISNYVIKRDARDRDLS